MKPHDAARGESSLVDRPAFELPRIEYERVGALGRRGRPLAVQHARGQLGGPDAVIAEVHDVAADGPVTDDGLGEGIRGHARRSRDLRRRGGPHEIVVVRVACERANEQHGIAPERRDASEDVGKAQIAEIRQTDAILIRRELRLRRRHPDAIRRAAAGHHDGSTRRRLQAHRDVQRAGPPDLQPRPGQIRLTSNIGRGSGIDRHEHDRNAGEQHGAVLHGDAETAARHRHHEIEPPAGVLANEQVTELALGNVVDEQRHVEELRVEIHPAAETRLECRPKRFVDRNDRGDDPRLAVEQQHIDPARVLGRARRHEQNHQHDRQPE